MVCRGKVKCSLPQVKWLDNSRVILTGLVYFQAAFLWDADATVVKKELRGSGELLCWMKRKGKSENL